MSGPGGRAFGAGETVSPAAVPTPRAWRRGWASLDARRGAPRTALDLRLTGARFESLLPTRFEGAPPLTGPVWGRAKLTGQGDSLHRALGGADGQVVVVSTAGAPKLGFQAGGAAAQAGIGATLGSLLTPLAAILPFVDPGLAKNADCAGLVAGTAAAAPRP